MEQKPIRTVEMMRAIRDRLYEETKNLSREEFKAFVAREGKIKRTATKVNSSDQSAA
ncbi:MAG: hypothetical protein H0U67_02030 [Gemmatimonadetes bacterium]|jgi:hypothetical protein|nr:hypothetical protein [Gemmatimonadota bacterium]